MSGLLAIILITHRLFGLVMKNEKIQFIGRDQQFAKQIFKKLMKHVSEDIETADFKMPDSV